jgi:hypothetical protein
MHARPGEQASLGCECAKLQRPVLTALRLLQASDGRRRPRSASQQRTPGAELQPSGSAELDLLAACAAEEAAAINAAKAAAAAAASAEAEAAAAACMLALEPAQQQVGQL